MLSALCISATLHLGVACEMQQGGCSSVAAPQWLQHLMVVLHDTVDASCLAVHVLNAE